MRKVITSELVSFSTLAEVQDIVEFEPKEFIAQGGKVIELGR